MQFELWISGSHVGSPTSDDTFTVSERIDLIVLSASCDLDMKARMLLLLLPKRVNTHTQDVNMLLRTECRNCKVSLIFNHLSYSCSRFRSISGHSMDWFNVRKAFFTVLYNYKQCIIFIFDHYGGSGSGLGHTNRLEYREC